MLDPYFMGKWMKKNVEKPSRRLTGWWKDILLKLENRKSPRWTDLGYILLNVAYDDQEKFEDGFKKIRNLVKKSRRSSHDIATLFNGPSQRRDMIIGLAYKPTTRQQCYQWIKQAVDHGMTIEKTNRALVIAIDVEQQDYPYSVIACLQR